MGLPLPCEPRRDLRRPTYPQDRCIGTSGVSERRTRAVGPELAHQGVLVTGFVPTGHKNQQLPGAASDRSIPGLAARDQHLQSHGLLIAG